MVHQSSEIPSDPDPADPLSTGDSANTLEDAVEDELALHAQGLRNLFRCNDAEGGRHAEAGCGADPAGQVHSGLLAAKLIVHNFLVNGDRKNADAFNEQWVLLSDMLDRAASQFKSPGYQKIIGNMQSLLRTYRAGFERVVEIERQIGEQSRVLYAIGPDIERRIVALSESAGVAEGNIKIALRTARVMRQVLLGRVYCARFLDKYHGEDAEKMLEHFREFAADAADLLPLLEGSEFAAELASLTDLARQYVEAFGEVRALAAQRTGERLPDDAFRCLWKQRVA